MKSLWENTATKPRFNPLSRDTKTDVLIIGGGMAGVLCALELDKVGVDYILLEANHIGSGITRNTTAKITAQHGLIYSKISDNYGSEFAKEYLDINQEAVKKYKELCCNIDCDYEEKASFVYTLRDREKIEKEIKALDKIGYNAKFTKRTPLPLVVAGAVGFENQAQFNPLKFLYSISKGLNIHENVRVKELVGTTAITDQGKVDAEKIIVATHFPFINKHGYYFAKMYQHRSYVLGLKNAPKVNGMYVDADLKGLSFRDYGDILLLGGGSHRTGKKGGSYNELRDFVRRYYPRAEECCHFATQDCETLDGIPYIGQYAKNTENLYVATGFNKWGMTSSMVAAIILRDKILGVKNPYSEIFDPSRSVVFPQLGINIFESVCGLAMPTTKRCPHLGCGLKWNKWEHTWDCPCHGSRFSEDGSLIDNPATGDLKD
ncbi:MAG: FAD-dependent oxidoreductase [Clostridia bacterium]|nr:FAD-dependent oxidoreductase [Clostridia bacterium]